MMYSSKWSSVAVYFFLLPAFIGTSALAEVPLSANRIVGSNLGETQSVIAADLDQDGDLDLLGGVDESQQFFWWENAPAPLDAGPTWIRHQIAFGSYADSFPADIDGDGDLDSVTAIGYRVWWFENLGSEGKDRLVWARHSVSAISGRTWMVRTGDLDGDGDLDIVGASSGGDYGITWWENRGPVGEEPWAEYPVATLQASSVVVADFDGDGDLDLAGSSPTENTVAWFENVEQAPGAITWAEHTVSNTLEYPYRIAIADLDGDEDPDLLAGAREGDGEVVWLENTNSAGFGGSWPHHNIGRLVGPTAVSAADLDQDGDLDVMATDGPRDLAVWWENNNQLPDELSWKKFVIDTAMRGPRELLAADLDGDNDLDIYGAAARAGEILWWENESIAKNDPGDCDSDGSIDTMDLQTLAEELLDHDGTYWLDAPSSDVDGDPTGCDANADQRVDAADVVALDHLLNGAACDNSLPSGGQPSIQIEYQHSVGPGGQLTIPIRLSSAGHPITSLAFSLDLGPDLTFDATDSDGDGLPDSVRLPGSSPSRKTLRFDARDSDAELAIFLADLGPDPSPFPDGNFVEIDFSTSSAPGSLLENQVRFAASVSASFSNAVCQSTGGIAEVTRTTPGFGVIGRAMRDPRRDHTATLLLDGRVLVAGGSITARQLFEAEIYNPITGEWSQTGDLSFPRQHSTATLLPSGKVLVIGGSNAGQALDSAELYDPENGTWTLFEGWLNEPRASHTATLLPDGRILIIGGDRPAQKPLSSVEISRPTLIEGADLVSPMRGARSSHTATLLADGRILVIGGAGDYSRTTEFFNPKENSWSQGPDLHNERWTHSATRLDSGEVIVVGGADTSGVSQSSAEILDPADADSVWELQESALSIDRRGHGATLLPSGKLLITGGQQIVDAENLVAHKTEVDIYDPFKRSWSPASPLALSRSRHAATLLPSGRVLLTGGEGILTILAETELYEPPNIQSKALSNSRAPHALHTATFLPSSGQVLLDGFQASLAELYDPKRNDWLSSNGSCVDITEGHTATRLLSGEILVAGGVKNPDANFSDPDDLVATAIPQATARLYDPRTDTWRPTGSLHDPRAMHTATLLPSGEVLVVGGRNSSEVSFLKSAEIYDPLKGIWRMLGSGLATERFLHTATLLPSGEVLVAGGWRSRTALASAEIFDPETEVWREIPQLAAARSRHTATLLPSGLVLVSGGSETGSAELFDPVSETWELTGQPLRARLAASATLLPDGKVLVTGGLAADEIVTASSEFYDPTTESWSAAPSLASRRFFHTATLLPSGEVFIFGGFGPKPDPTDVNGEFPAQRDGELLRFPSRSFGRVPEILEAPAMIRPGEPFLIKGNRFGGGHEIGTGAASSSAVNYPLVRLQHLDSGELAYAMYEPLESFSGDPLTLTVNHLPALRPGPHRLSVVVAGIASEPHLVDVHCGLSIDLPPQDQAVEIGQSATFTVHAQGARRYQWFQDGDEIPGATETSYTTSTVLGPEAGTRFQVRVSNGCATDVSAAATLAVNESVPPNVSVDAPDGGEFWVLSSNDPDTPLETEIVSWSMGDNVRVCRVDVELLFSNDGGQVFQPVPPGGGLPRTFPADPSIPCRLGEAPTSTFLTYSVPTEPPSGTPGSLYKIRVRVTDHAGLVNEATSTNPFFVVQRDPELVRTLILTHPDRIGRAGASDQDLADLGLKLRELSEHPRVAGRIVNLGNVPSLEALYAAWDTLEADPESALIDLHAAANDVLFAPGGLHEHLRDELLVAFPGVEHLILVGDDRIVPMARMVDRTVLLLESAYVAQDPLVPVDLTPDGTTVGKALAADRYLTDDPLATLGTFNRVALDDPDNVFLPDLAVGRLVETPQEIITAIAAFLSQDGALDLSCDGSGPCPAHRAQITAYDFLIDSGQVIGDRWTRRLGGPLAGQPLAPIDAELVGPDWGEPEMIEHLCGNGGEPYRLLSLNGHATHYEEGYPGDSFTDIVGLRSTALPGLCADGLDLTGAIAYAVGCHGGLPVAGSDAAEDHPFDLPQAMLGRGVQAYVANSGYGWGLLHGIGYSERLVQIMTEELGTGRTVSVGDAILRTKSRYFLENLRFDAYDAKTSMQWTLFGFPMYTLRLSEVPDEPDASNRTARGSTDSSKTRICDGERVEHLGPVVVRTRCQADARNGDDPTELPPFLTRVDIEFDYSADGVYTKRDAAGNALLGAEPGCPDPLGCYYTLNTLVERASGASDLPIQPFFPYDSRLGGTSQHGILWTGATYTEEEDWRPIFATLISNAGCPDGVDDDPSDGCAITQDSSPRRRVHRPRGPRDRRPDDTDCRVADLEVGTLVMAAGEVWEPQDDVFVQRLYQDIDLEILYLNNTLAPEENCDRQGPAFGPGPYTDGDGKLVYHRTSGSTISWEVPVLDVLPPELTDPARDPADEVWRVLVLYDDELVNAAGEQSWDALELTNAEDGRWTASLTLPGVERLTYMLQAVDKRGNVAWVDFVPAVEPASRVDLEIPYPFEVVINPSPPVLSIDLETVPDPVPTEHLMHHQMRIENTGLDPATELAVQLELPSGSVLASIHGDGWVCQAGGTTPGTVLCELAALTTGSSSLSVFSYAPSLGGWVTSLATLDAAEIDTYDPTRHEASASTLVIDETMTDLAISLETLPLMIRGRRMYYILEVMNHGPNPAIDAVVASAAMPPELERLAWTCVATAGSSCPSSGVGEPVLEATLLSGGRLVIEVEGRVRLRAPSEIEIGARVTVPIGMNDFEPGNDWAASTIPIETASDIILFDDFESGDTSGWSTTVPSTDGDTSESPID